MTEQDGNNNEQEGDNYLAASFCRENLWLVLQRRNKWMFPDSTVPVEQELFAAFLKHFGFKSKENWKRGKSKDKRVQRLRSFDIAITNWLHYRYPSYSPFVYSSTINYDNLEMTEKQLQRQALLQTPNGFETELDISPFPNRCYTNRRALLECGGDCDGSCGNKESTEDFNWQDFMKLEYISHQVGAGLKAIVDLPKYTFLGVVTGEALTETQLVERAGGPNWSYLFSTRPDTSTVVHAIDPQRYGNHTRFYNHSCSPNCLYEIWLADQKWICKLYTLRKIHKGEELTIDYEWRSALDGQGFHEEIECHCNSVECRGYI